LARPRDDACRTALHKPLSQRRGPLRRGSQRAAEPRLSEAVGGAEPDRAAAGPGRDLSRSRIEPRRLELGIAADRRAGDQRRQGAARPRNRPHPQRRASAGERFRARPAYGRTGRLAVLGYRVLSGAASDAGRALACRRNLPQLRLHDQIPGSDRPRDSPPLRRDPGLAEACADTEILINNAGAIPGGNIDAIDEARWRTAWDLKVFGYINMTRRFYALMRERKKGVIINILGAAGENPDFDYVAGSSG